LTIDSNFFEFTSDKEQSKFSEYLELIRILISKHPEQIEKKLKPYQMHMYNSIDAFKLVFSVSLHYSNSSDLINFYSIFSQKNNIDIQITEIVLDSIMDISRFRSNLENATADDKALASIFKQYENSYMALAGIFDGLVNAMMSLYDSSSLSQDDKKMQLIKESIPVIVRNANIINSLSDDNYFDIWLVHYIVVLKEDLAKITRSAESRFRSFFSANEFNKIQKLNSDQLHTYLGAASAENPNLREAKNLLKIIGETDFHLKEIAKLDESIKITKDMESKVENYIKQLNENILESI
jgi:hypothetical protein